MKRADHTIPAWFSWAFFVCAMVTLNGCALNQFTSSPRSKDGRALFEIFGMQDEYMGRPLADGEHIERFYPHEKKQARQFGLLLDEWTQQEGLNAHWTRSKGTGGHHYFDGATLRRQINSHYLRKPDWEIYIDYPLGTLNPTVFRSATRADLLRFVSGAYSRFGQHSRRQAIIDTANGHTKLNLVANVLARLGCSNIELYDDSASGNVPVSNVLLFTPTDEVKQYTGIQRALTMDEAARLIRERELKPTVIKKLNF